MPAEQSPLENSTGSSARWEWSRGLGAAGPPAVEPVATLAGANPITSASLFNVLGLQQPCEGSAPAAYCPCSAPLKTTPSPLPPRTHTQTHPHTTPHQPAAAPLAFAPCAAPWPPCSCSSAPPPPPQADSVDIAYPPLVQSGGEYDLRLAAGTSKDSLIHYGVIVCHLGARWAGRRGAGAVVPTPAQRGAPHAHPPKRHPPP